MKTRITIFLLLQILIVILLSGCKEESSTNPWDKYEPAVYIQNVDGTNRVKLLDGKWDHLMMTPDETKLILSNGSSRIYVYDITTSTLETVHESEGELSSPTLSKNGKKLTFNALSSESNTLDIYVYDLETKIKTNLTNTPRANEYYPLFSNDCTRIAYGYRGIQPDSMPHKLMIMNTDGSNKTALYEANSNLNNYVFTYTFSLNDSKLYYYSSVFRTYNLVPTKHDCTVDSLVTKFVVYTSPNMVVYSIIENKSINYGPGYKPIISLDGKYLLYNDDAEIYNKVRLIDLETNTRTVVVSGTNANYTSDGHKIIYVGIK